MIYHRANGVRVIHTAIDVLAGQLVFFCSWGAWFFQFGLDEPPYYSVAASLALSMLLSAALLAQETQKKGLRIGWLDCHQRCFGQVISIGMFWILTMFAFGILGTVPRLFAAAVLLGTYGVLALSNKFGVVLLAKVLLNGSANEPTVLIGTDEHNQRLSKWINESELMGIRVASHLNTSLDGDPSSLEAHLTAMEGSLRAQRVRQILVLALPSSKTVLRTIAAFANRLGARLLIINDLHDYLGHSLTMFSYNGQQMIAMRKEPLENPFNRCLKRIVDLAISIPCVIILLPWSAALVWITQRLQSPGPMFYRQARAGLNNKPFMILKFRTMHVGHKDETRQASSGDSRIFFAGRLLRRFSMDELPQLLNVVKGDMSLVGPRPHMLDHNEVFEFVQENYNIRCLVKPGLTGLAQVRGHRGEVRTREDLEKRVNSDVYYLEHWSLGLDALILMRTVATVIIPPPSAV